MAIHADGPRPLHLSSLTGWYSWLLTLHVTLTGKVQTGRGMVARAGTDVAARASKHALLYDELRLALQSGRYVPGQRIDARALAQKYTTSPTPVLCALNRLVGEGMIVDHAHYGFHVPVPTEVTLRDQYDWMERLLVMACDLGIARARKTNAASDALGHDDDTVMQTRALFEAIALATGHSCLYQAVQHINDRLTPVRRVKHRLFPSTRTELATLTEHWRRRQLKALRLALIDYHEHRKALVPRIVAALRESSPM